MKTGKANNIFKHSISMTKFIIIISLVNMALYHLPLYSFAISNLNIFSFNGILTFFAVLVSLFVVTAFILFVFAIISYRLVKVFSILMMIGNSIALYFIVTYQVILDRTMMGNVFNTDTAEAASYYHPKIFLYLFFLGIIPAFLISKIHIKKPKRIRLALHALGVVVIGVLLMYLNAGTWLWLDEHAKRLGGMTMPWSYTINAIRYKARQLKKTEKQILLPSAKFSNDDRMVVILVIGESARAKNFSLYGYTRETNPYLEKMENITVLKAKSTATYTTASVHSMLSYTGSDSDSYEPLPNYLQREGVDVIWRKNNWGEPILHVKTFETAGELKASCKGDGCDYDEVLLTNLDKEILESKKKKVFVVLHTVGSHGPIYHEKYPKKFEIFKPVCKTVDLKECTNQELINAYDNTILYTDFFLGKTIDTLKKIKDVPILLIYTSDHGESLGEYGLYLHGTPYSIAPDVQKNIPFIIWTSKSFVDKKGIQKIDFKERDTYSHKNIFHTIMGAFGINSTIYNKQLDILQKD